MTEIRFYHLQQKRLEQALPEIVARALEREYRIVVKCADKERVEALDKALWMHAPDNFLPHGSLRDGFEAEQPVWLTTEDENPNAATMLVLTDGVASALAGDFPLCCEVFDGNDTDVLATARAHWKEYKDKGYALSYFQQDDAGKWQKKEG